MLLMRNRASINRQNGWIASPIMQRFECCFRHVLRDQMYFVTH